MIEIKRMNEVGDRVFLNPKPQLSYEELAKRSLGSNTYRGFHRVNKNLPGASKVFNIVLMENRNVILESLEKAASENDINKLQNLLCDRLKEGLEQNIRPDQLSSFNRLRKPMDIVLEHMVSMGHDFGNVRSKITKWLYLPLDSQIFQSKFIFTDAQIKQLKIKRSWTFSDLREEDHYHEIQQFLKGKARQLGVSHRIYFDLIWNDRYKSNGTNLFQTNPRGNGTLA